MTSLIIFNGIYRIEDNNALLYALRESHILIPIFIIDPLYKTKYHHRNFLYNVMKSMYNDFKKFNINLYCFMLDMSSVIKHITSKVSISSIYINRTYTYPESTSLRTLELVCKSYDIKLNICNDILLTHLDKPVNYNTYIDTYYNHNTIENIDKPDKKILEDLHNVYSDIFSYDRYIFNKCIDIDNTNYKYEFNILGKIWNDYIDINDKDYKIKFRDTQIKGTRKEALDILNDQAMNETIYYYRLLPYIRHGILSSREIFYEIVNKKYNTLMINVISSPLIHYILKREHVYNLSRFDINRIYINNDKQSITKRTINKDILVNANTNIPIIDACIRQITIQGYTEPKIKFILYRYYKLYVTDKDNNPSYFNYLIDYDELLDREMWNGIIDSKTNYLDIRSYVFRHKLKYIIDDWLLKTEIDKSYNIYV